MATKNQKASVSISNNLLHVSSCPGSHVINLSFGGEESKPVKGVDYFTPDEIEEITNQAAEKAADLVDVNCEAEDSVVEFDVIPGTEKPEENPEEDDVVEF